MSNLDRAHEIRRFEIELYWKRSAYFWTFIALAFGGYGALQMSQGAKNTNLDFLLTNVGIVATYAWFLVNRGSKYWQEVWETQVDFFEDQGQGRIYKAVIGRVAKGNKCKDRFEQWTAGAPRLSSCDENPMCLYVPSVSKINQLGSLYVIFVWIFLAVRSLPLIDISAGFDRIDWFMVLFVALTMSAIWTLRRWGRSRARDYTFRVEFRKAVKCSTDY